MDYYHPTEPPPPKNHTLRNVMVGAFGCLFFVGVITALVLVKFFSAEGGPSRAVQEHLNRINEGNLTGAYASFTREYKNQHTIDDFRGDVALFSDQLPSRRSRFSHVSVTNNSAEVEGTLTGRDGSLFPVFYRLTRVKGEWKIDDFRWESPGEQQSL